LAAPIIWKQIDTAFKGRAVGGSYAVEDRIVRVRTPLGEKTAEFEGTNAALETTRGGHGLTKSPITIDRPADDDCADECPDKYVEPSVSEQIAGNDAEHSANNSRD